MAQAEGSEVPADGDIGILPQVLTAPSPATSDTDSPLDYYHLERYLFETVRPRFFRDQGLNAFDLFSIIIWKANRAKSRIAHKLVERNSGRCLDEIAMELTRAVFTAADPRSQFETLWNAGFRLPMASAILTVLWPEEFTVYDVRVCEQLTELGDASTGSRLDGLADATDLDMVWRRYQDYVNVVRSAVPGPLSLRDKDRILWAQSAMAQLRRDVATAFKGEDHERASATIA